MAVEIVMLPNRDEGKESISKVKAASEKGPTEVVSEPADVSGTGVAKPMFSESASDAPERTVVSEEHKAPPEKNAKESGPITVVAEWPKPAKEAVKAPDPAVVDVQPEPKKTRLRKASTKKASTKKRKTAAPNKARTKTAEDKGR
jgi:hypothetical protein